MNERFNSHLHAAQPGAQGFLQRLPAAQMDNVNGRAGQFGKGHEMLNALGLDAGRAAFVMSAGSRAAGGEEVFLRFGHEGFVFTMGRGHDAEFFGEFERLVEFAIVDAEGPLVS